MHMNLQIKIKEYEVGQIIVCLLIKYSGFFILLIGEEELQENENPNIVHLKVQVVSNKSTVDHQKRQLWIQPL